MVRLNSSVGLDNRQDESAFGNRIPPSNALTSVQILPQGRVGGAGYHSCRARLCQGLQSIFPFIQPRAMVLAFQRLFGSNLCREFIFSSSVSDQGAALSTFCQVRHRHGAKLFGYRGQANIGASWLTGPI